MKRTLLFLLLCAALQQCKIPVYTEANNETNDYILKILIDDRDENMVMNICNSKAASTVQSSERILLSEKLEMLTIRIRGINEKKLQELKADIKREGMALEQEIKMAE